VTGADGAQVLNSAGNPMLAPSRANMDKVADELKSDFMNNKENSVEAASGISSG